MAIFGQIPKEELGTKYTHYGWFAGLCPVYLADLGSEAPTIVERNWVPAIWLSIATELFGAAILLRSTLDERYEPMWPVAITGEING